MNSRKYRFWRVITMLFAILAAYLRRRPDQASSIVFYSFRELGGIYVKFLQLLALQPGFFEDWEIKEKLEIFDNVEVEYIDIRATLQSKLSAKQRTEFASIDTTVVSSGSFAQVYNATLRDGTPVIVKILRPSVLQFLGFDQRCLWLISRILHVFAARQGVSIVRVYDEFREVTTNETNYKREAYFAELLRKRYTSQPESHIVIPKTYQQLSSRQLLVQERINGLPLTDILARKESHNDVHTYVHEQLGSDLYTQLSHLGIDMFYQSIMNKETHGDPHPGNIFLLSDNRIGLVDFGVIGSPPKYRAEFFELVVEYERFYRQGFEPGEFFKKSLQFYSNDLYRAMIFMDQVADSNESILSTLASMASDMYQRNKNDPNVQRYLRTAQLRSVFTHIINPHNQYAIPVEIDAGVVQKAGSTLLSMLNQLECKNEVMRIVYSEVVRRIYAEGMPRQHSKPISLESSAETLSSWLHKIARNDPMLFKRLTKSEAMHV